MFDPTRPAGDVLEPRVGTVVDWDWDVIVVTEALLPCLPVTASGFPSGDVAASPRAAGMSRGRAQPPPPFRWEGEKGMGYEMLGFVGVLLSVPRKFGPSSIWASISDFRPVPAKLPLPLSRIAPFSAAIACVAADCVF